MPRPTCAVRRAPWTTVTVVECRVEEFLKHPMAIHNATPCSALLLVAGPTYKLTHRYETWVQYRSRLLPRRAHLEDLARELSALDDVPWRADPVDDLTPELQPDGGSSLDPKIVIEAVVRHLRTAPPAFDPFAERNDAR